jgi:hypothetical protein
MKNQLLIMGILVAALMFGMMVAGCENPTINWDAPSGYVDPAILHTGLPVVTINTVGQKKITSRTNYLPAAIEIDDPNDDDNDLAAEAEIRGRGNAT